MFYLSSYTPRKLTGSAKARQTKLYRLIDAIEVELAKCTDAEQVLAVLQAQPHGTPTQKGLLADAFMALDDNYRSTNHALVRQARNTPELGYQIFALWA